MNMFALLLLTILFHLKKVSHSPHNQALAKKEVIFPLINDGCHHWMSKEGDEESLNLKCLKSSSSLQE